MITVALSTTIGASSERVWRALVDPEERPVWDERILGRAEPRRVTSRRHPKNRESATQATTDKATPQRHREPIHETRWRFRLGRVPMVMHDAVLESDATRRLVSHITIGSMQLDQTLTLHSEDDGSGPSTRLGMKLVAHNTIAVIGEVVPRLDVQKLVIEFADTTLRQVQKHCETQA